MEKFNGTTIHILRSDSIAANWCIHAAQGLRGVGGDAGLCGLFIIQLKT